MLGEKETNRLYTFDVIPVVYYINSVKYVSLKKHTCQSFRVDAILHIIDECHGHEQKAIQASFELVKITQR